MGWAYHIVNIVITGSLKEPGGLVLPRDNLKCNRCPGKGKMPSDLRNLLTDSASSTLLCHCQCTIKLILLVMNWQEETLKLVVNG